MTRLLRPRFENSSKTSSVFGESHFFGPTWNFLSHELTLNFAIKPAIAM